MKTENANKPHNIFHDRPDKGEGSDNDSMKTLSSTTIKLSQNGYVTQFKALKNNELESLETHRVFKPDEVKIINFYRFEGDSDPSDNAILYVVETSTGEKGTLTDAYGVYTDLKVSEFVKQVEEIEKANTNPPADLPPEEQELGVAERKILKALFVCFWQDGQGFYF